MFQLLTLHEYKSVVEYPGRSSVSKKKNPIWRRFSLNVQTYYTMNASVVEEYKGRVYCISFQVRFIFSYQYFVWFLEPYINMKVQIPFVKTEYHRYICGINCIIRFSVCKTSLCLCKTEDLTWFKGCNKKYLEDINCNS